MLAFSMGFPAIRKRICLPTWLPATTEFPRLHPWALDRLAVLPRSCVLAGGEECPHGLVVRVCPAPVWSMPALAADPTRGKAVLLAQRRRSQESGECDAIGGGATGAPTVVWLDGPGGPSRAQGPTLTRSGLARSVVPRAVDRAVALSSLLPTPRSSVLCNMVPTTKQQRG